MANPEIDTMATRRLLIETGLDQAAAAETATEWASACRAVAGLLDRYDELAPPARPPSEEEALLAELAELSNING